MSDARRVVVTGLGLATPIGLGMEAFWDGLLSGSCGIKRIEAFDPSGFPAPFGGELPGFTLGDYIPKPYRKSAKVMARDIIIALICAYHAVKDAGLVTKCIQGRGETDGEPNVDSTRFGANIGAGLICADLPDLASALVAAAESDGSFSMKKWGSEGMGHLTPLWMLKFLPNMLACHVTIVHDAEGPSNTITCGEASSHLAIGEAFRTIRRGAADVCICGGAESKMNPMAVARPLLQGRLVTDAEEGTTASRPFAADCLGMVPAEGGGLVILESLDHARARGARIYAEVIGLGSSNNIKSWHEPDLDGDAMASALTKALRRAGIQPDDVDLVAPLGSGMAAWDAAEMAGYRRVFGDSGKLAAMTTRGSLGNNGAGTGAIDFAAAVLAMHHNMIPPSVNTSPADDASPFSFVEGDAQDAPVRLAVTSAYALAGGQHAALVIRRFEE